MESESKRIITRAMEILERDGWCQHQARNPEGAHCAGGALALAVIKLFNWDWRRYDAASGKILSLLPEGYTFIFQWNDDRKTTYEDVMLMFKRAVEDDA